MRETAGEVAERIVRTILAADGQLSCEATVNLIEAALTAERDARERAERENVETRAQWLDALKVLAADRVPQTTDTLPVMLADVLAERDTLRQHNAVLRAECRAGRAMEDCVSRDLRDPTARSFDGLEYSNAVDAYEAARQQTDAAGAMGEV